MNALLQVLSPLLEQTLHMTFPLVLLLGKLHIRGLLSGAGRYFRLNNAPEVVPRKSHCLFEQSCLSRPLFLQGALFLVYVFDARKVKSSLSLADNLL